MMPTPSGSEDVSATQAECARTPSDTHGSLEKLKINTHAGLGSSIQSGGQKLPAGSSQPAWAKRGLSKAEFEQRQ